MAQSRDLKKEQMAVDSWFKSKGSAPSLPSDWKSIHASAYGSDLPAELASLPMYQASTPAPTLGTPASTNPQSNTDSLNYRGQNISDSALTGARTSADSYNTSGFLDQVKERLQKKFKPETETLGLGAFSATLGALDPTGVMNGINEKTGQFRRKGKLALQALSTANDIYSEQAALAEKKLTRLEEARGLYEKEQKDIEEDMKSLALAIAKTGKAIPDDILNLLPANMRSVYQGLPKVLFVPKVGSGGGSGNFNSPSNEPTLSKEDFEKEFIKKYGELKFSNPDVNNPAIRKQIDAAYKEYQSTIKPASAANMDKYQKDNDFTELQMQKLENAGLLYSSRAEQISFLLKSEDDGLDFESL